MKTLGLTVGSLLILACAFGAALAGTVIVIDTWAYDQYSESGTHTLYLDEDRARVEFKSKESETVIIYHLENKDDPMMWLIEVNEHAYTEIGKEGLKKMQNQILQGKEMMDNYLAQLSAEEREQVKQQYRKQIRQFNKLLTYEDRKKKMTYEKVESGVEMNGWKCDHYKGIFEKELYNEIWLSDPKVMGVEEKEIAVLNDMAELFKGFAGDMIPLVNAKTKGGDERINGFPLKIVSYEDGNKYMRKQVKEVRKEDLDPNMFDLPEGLDQRPIE